MVQITMVETTLKKNPYTKTTYIVESEETKEITERQHDLTTNDETCKWFRRLGGSESKEMQYTCNGYKCTKLTSTSPDKQTKKIRKFTFKWID